MKALLGSVCILALASGVSVAAPEKDAPATKLSEHIRGFLKREMISLAETGRAIEAAIAKGDSKAVASLARQTEKAFIFEQDITTMDLRELEVVLGDDFVARDKAFHASGRALEAAAKANDLEGQRRIFGDMLRDCAACHQAYAPEAPVLE